MTHAPSELSRILRVSDVGRTNSVAVVATPAECKVLADRFDLLALDSLSAEVTVRAIAGGVALSGTVVAALTQRCVASDAPVPAKISEPFDLRFVRHSVGKAVVEEDGEEGVALDADDCDTLPLENEQVDVGEVVAQTLALAIPPFPRHHQADAMVKSRGVNMNQPTGPFAGLAGLALPKDKG